MKTPFARLWSAIRGDKYMVDAYPPTPDVGDAALPDSADPPMPDASPPKES